MATRARQTTTETSPETEDPPETEEPKGLGARIDAIEEKLERFLDGASKSGGTQTRTQKESATREQIREEMANLRKAESEEKGRAELVAKVEKLEKSLKDEKPPQVFSGLAKFFFPSGAKS